MKKAERRIARLLYQIKMEGLAFAFKGRVATAFRLAVLRAWLATWFTTTWFATARLSAARFTSTRRLFAVHAF